MPWCSDSRLSEGTVTQVLGAVDGIGGGGGLGVSEKYRCLGMISVTKRLLRWWVPMSCTGEEKSSIM